MSLKTVLVFLSAALVFCISFVTPNPPPLRCPDGSSCSHTSWQADPSCCSGASSTCPRSFVATHRNSTPEACSNHCNVSSSCHQWKWLEGGTCCELQVVGGSEPCGQGQGRRVHTKMLGSAGACEVSCRVDASCDSYQYEEGTSLCCRYLVAWARGAGGGDTTPPPAERGEYGRWRAITFLVLVVCTVSVVITALIGAVLERKLSARTHQAPQRSRSRAPRAPSRRGVMSAVVYSPYVPPTSPPPRYEHLRSPPPAYDPLAGESDSQSETNSLPPPYTEVRAT